MWDGLAVLILLCVVMAGASYLAGSLPLLIPLSERKRQLITALGTGVLVGTSLIVIIPEGIETLYSATGSSHSHNARSLSWVTKRGVTPSEVQGASIPHVWRMRDERIVANILRSSDSMDNPKRAEDDDDDNDDADSLPSSDTGNEDGTIPGEQEIEDDEQDSDGDEATYDPHAWVGLSLITGFILMYLIDTLPKYATTASRPQRFPISLNQFSFNRTASLPAEPETASIGDTFPNNESHDHNSRPSSTTVGLVIHAAADGIALGASSTTTSRLSFIIFIALMIHKAPAAFGLTSVLLKQGLSTRMARAHLIVFALAAPVGALLTWAGAHLLGFSVGNDDSTEFATGILLLFSGGTFLYVAMHTMQESGGHDHGNQANGYTSLPMSVYGEQGTSASTPRRASAGRLADTLVTVVGMLIPLLTQFGHGH